MGTLTENYSLKGVRYNFFFQAPKQSDRSFHEVVWRYGLMIAQNRQHFDNMKSNKRQHQGYITPENLQEPTRHLFGEDRRALADICRAAEELEALQKGIADSGTGKGLTWKDFRSAIEDGRM